MQKEIRYIADIKYSLYEGYIFESKIIVNSIIRTYFFDIYPRKDGSGSIWTVRTGYPWDGPSGPTIDTSNAMRGSLEHDVKYDAMRQGLVDKQWRHTADEELRDVCIEDGMSHIRADAWLIGVHDFAAYAADPKNRKEVLTAPRR